MSRVLWGRQQRDFSHRQEQTSPEVHASGLFHLHNR
nr:MAG TPA: hypothetical protein [Caudoviricetes sp.]